jgi:hypothetical protein
MNNINFLIYLLRNKYESYEIMKKDPKYFIIFLDELESFRILVWKPIALI